MASRIMMGIGTPSSQSKRERPMKYSPKLKIVRSTIDVPGSVAAYMRLL